MGARRYDMFISIITILIGAVLTAGGAQELKNG
jgi:hypothetical protein